MYKNQLISDGYDEGIEVGRNEGHAEGIKQNKESTVKIMLNLNYPKEEISKITGKSINEIEEISLKN